ncbi:MAG TPA: hypothetical protein VHN98_10545 [Acidimicrobiales bacterium]|nr:hypothetical protein [Acidimicrobiales bacterium]
MPACPRIPPDFDAWVSDCVVALRERGEVPEEPLLRAALIGLGALDAITMNATGAFQTICDAVARRDESLLRSTRLDIARLATLDPAVAALAG